MRLHRLCKVEHATQLRGRMRNLDRHDCFAGLRGSDKVAHRADTADARHQARHFVERTPLTELLKTAHLGDGKEGLIDGSVVAGLQRNFAVAFKTCYRIDRNCLRHGESPMHQSGLGLRCLAYGRPAVHSAPYRKCPPREGSPAEKRRRAQTREPGALSRSAWEPACTEPVAAG